MSDTRSRIIQRYPVTLGLDDGTEVTLRLTAADDVDRIVTFARGLPEDDLLFLRIDITDREVVRRWVQQQGTDGSITLIAEAKGEMAGYGSLICSELSWQRHLGEARLLVSRRYRSQGLGRRLAGEVYQIARDLGLRKIVAQMTPDQKGAVATFERHGFHAEALLQDFVIDRHGRTRDLVVMAYDVESLSHRVD